MGETAKWLMRTGLVMMAKFGKGHLIVGATSPRSLAESEIARALPNTSYSGMAWLLNANAYVAYNGTRTIDLKQSVMECACAACSGRPANQVSREIKTIAEHNLIEFKSLLNGGKTMPASSEVFDAVIEGGLTAVVADLHIGRVLSLWRECFKELERLKPNRVIFLGDTHDFKYGKPFTFEFDAFGLRLIELDADAIPLRGCCDSSFADLERITRGILFGKRPFRLPGPYDYRPEAVGRLMAFYGMSKDRARIRLPDGKIAIFEHGHRLGVDRAASLDDVKAALLKDKEPGTIRVIGHFHRSLFEPDEGVIMLGCWQTMTSEEENLGIAPDIMEVLLIREDGTFEIHRGEI